VALEWFKPGLTGLTEEPPTWLEDWDAFVEELKTNFGPYNKSGDVESELVNLPVLYTPSSFLAESARSPRRVLIICM